MSVVKPLTNHTSPETAYVVDDYPYGYILRCKIRYWIEESRTHGFRHVSQTTNPRRKGEPWNTPKRGTYCKVALGMYLNEENHVKFCGLSHYSDAAESKEFKAEFGECLNDSAMKSLDTWIFLKEKYEAARDARLNSQAA